MKRFLIATAGWLAVAMMWQTVQAQDGEALAILIPGGGTYSRPISTDSAEAQAFFDQGLRMAWSFLLS